MGKQRKIKQINDGKEVRKIEREQTYLFTSGLSVLPTR